MLFLPNLLLPADRAALTRRAMALVIEPAVSSVSRHEARDIRHLADT
jgi:hypothetical protein